jgi:endonuclease/exonuclease/phosphatase family metal-dependent hydrolase
MNKPNTMKILTWNIGSFSFLKYTNSVNFSYKKNKILHEYFQPQINGAFVSDFIKKIGPDILFLQEIYSEKDILAIEALTHYSHQTLVSTWYHKHSILIASKSAFTIKSVGEFPVFDFGDMRIIPIHFNSFKATLRLKDVVFIKQAITTIQPVVVLGDTNFWKIKNFFFFRKDKEAYTLLTENLNDTSKQSGSTSVAGLEFDKIFCSKSIQVKRVTCKKVRGKFMDHYPLFVDITI